MEPNKQANKLRDKFSCIKKRKMVNVLWVNTPMLLLRISLKESTLNEQIYL